MNHKTIKSEKIKKEMFFLHHADVRKAVSAYPDNYFDLIITSPPYNVGKEYEKNNDLSFEEYLNWLEGVISILVSKLTKSGMLIWQVGNYVEKGEVFPLDCFFYDIFKKQGMKLRNRIVWRFNFGLNATNRFSGRYETLMCFSNSDEYTFNLDPVRVPQLYPGKRHSSSKGRLAGKPSGNPKGKNPSDYWEFDPASSFIDDPVWDIPNVKSNHPEKTIHPCQFPIELAERCILAFTNKSDKILDPFVGTGTSILAALKHNRVGHGIDNNHEYITIARDRILAFNNKTLKMRPSGKPTRRPRKNESVSIIPKEWK